MKSLRQFIKDWSLPISMSIGVLGYLLYHFTPALAPIGPSVHVFCSKFQPFLIFLMLFLQFNKLAPTDFRFHKWHLYLLIIQGVAFISLGLVIAGLPAGGMRILLESIMVCLICPTAIAAGVITDKLGGSLEGIMTYVALINALVAIIVPLMLPFIHPMPGLTFFAAFIKILYRIFPLLIMPCILAWFIRYVLPGVQRWLMKYVNAAFVLWNFSLCISMVLTTHSLVISHISFFLASMIGVSSLICCLVQFWLGRRIGLKTGGHCEEVTAGQALGQKNTVFGIWMGYTFLTPVTSVVGGFYCIWHNLINSRQLYKVSHPSTSSRDRSS